MGETGKEWQAKLKQYRYSHSKVQLNSDWKHQEGFGEPKAEHGDGNAQQSYE
ncbi:hypothetical protein EST38_g1585 [Candolleomyces aberdarensis]|uniref:Uncharacterized protein n=1 Tax=Candolleomyces aberdarensis TaxID=2316362 RepID=A0A4Q2DXS6_9AGAR|nr:hypothetical protein EST38_g1585 [Candolleomyces aberdarensis]